MITSNVIHRVFRIRFGRSEGTAFTIEVGQREYLITARHVVESIQDSMEIEVFSNGIWTPLRVNLVGHAPGNVDVSVVAASRRLTPPNLPMEATHKGITYGQDVYFLGFPYGFLGKYIFGPEGYPLPFVKKATLSQFDGKVFLLDGHNNPGFSGGPVVFAEPFTLNYKVAAVISGYKAVQEPVYAGGQPSNLTYLYNTGIIVSHSIDSTMEMIRANPIGFDLNSAAQPHRPPDALSGAINYLDLH